MSRRQHGTSGAGGGRQHQPQPQRPPAAGLLLAPGREAVPGPAGPNPAGSVPPPGTAFAPGPRAGASKEAGLPCNAGTASHPLSTAMAAAGQCQGPLASPSRAGDAGPEEGPARRSETGARPRGPAGEGKRGNQARRARARGRSGQRRAGPPHPVEVAGVAILPLRGQPLAERRDLADEQEGGGQQRGQRVVGPRQPAAQPGHRVQQRQQRRQHRHLGIRAHDRPPPIGPPTCSYAGGGAFYPLANGERCC